MRRRITHVFILISIVFIGCSLLGVKPDNKLSKYKEARHRYIWKNGNIIKELLGAKIPHSSISNKSEDDGGRTITYIGHATTLIKVRNKWVLTDPFWRNRAHFQKRVLQPSIQIKDLPPIDLILISHLHSDHCDLDAMKKIGHDISMVVPKGTERKFKNVGFKKIIGLSPWETYKDDSIDIIAVPAKHIGRCLGYLIKGDRLIYFTGDTKLHKDLEKIKEKYKVDIMLMPFGGSEVFGLIWSPKEASQAVEKVKPSIVIPIHWGTFSKITWFYKDCGPEEFKEMVEKISQNTKVIILSLGESLQIND